MNNEQITKKYMALKMIEGYLTYISKIGGKKKAYGWLQDDLETIAGQRPGVTIEMKEVFFEILPRLNGLKLYQKDILIDEEKVKYYHMLPKDNFGYAIFNAA